MMRKAVPDQTNRIKVGRGLSQVLPAYRSAVGKPKVVTKEGESYCARDESPTLVFSTLNKECRRTIIVVRDSRHIRRNILFLSLALYVSDVDQVMNKCGDETSQSRNLVIICWSSVVAQLHHTQWGRLLYNPIIRVVGGKFCEWEIRRVCVTPSFFFCIHGKKMFLWVFYLGFFGVYLECCFSTTRRREGSGSPYN